MIKPLIFFRNSIVYRRLCKNYRTLTISYIVRNTAIYLEKKEYKNEKTDKNLEIDRNKEIKPVKSMAIDASPLIELE